MVREDVADKVLMISDFGRVSMAGNGCFQGLETSVSCDGSSRFLLS